MGQPAILHRAWTKDDIIQHAGVSPNRAAGSALSQINQCIQHLIAPKPLHGQKEALACSQALYELALAVSLFVQKSSAELLHARQLRFQLLKLLHKIQQQQGIAHRPTAELLQAIGHVLMLQSPQALPPVMLHDLLTFETYRFLGLTAQLSSQDKFSVKKVRNVALYSQLLSMYRKPQIQPEHLEMYFQNNRSALLEQLVNSKSKIPHIHYDEDYLEQAVLYRLMLELNGKNADEFLNKQVQHELRA